MWNLIKNDPILKTITILIIGLFAFSFAFSIMFGGGTSGTEHAHDTATAGYSAATGLSQIIVLLSKILIIVLLVAVIIAAIKFVRKHVVGGEPIKGMDAIKNKPVLSVLVGIGGILILLLVMNLLSPAAGGTEMAHGTSSMASNQYGFGLAGLLSILLKLVAAISLIGLGTGLVMYFKDRYFNDIKLSILSAKESCSSCGTELKASWKCCPSCGTDINKHEVVEMIAEENGTN
ncbi:zinc ribbon domain-containing protein [Neobacillus sp. LXY-4]|uniref:zinc ribbon domain-containing protein n=1 Tax=Neobacillus sp. LXY-4 TaxID=3379826 RepID=UPI003EE369D1